MKAELIEALAAIEHERWADWQKYLHSKCVEVTRYDGVETHIEHHIPGEDYQRWERQILTPYEQLSEREKQSDRDEVMRYLPVVVEAFADWLEHRTDRLITGYNADVLVDALREEWGE